MDYSNINLNHDPDDVSCLDPSVAALLEPCDPSERRVRIALMKMQQARVRGNSDYAAKIMEHAIQEGAKDRQAWTLMDNHMKKLEAELAAAPPTPAKEEKDDKTKDEEDDDEKEDKDKEDTKDEDKKEEGEEEDKVTSEQVEKLKKEVEAEKEKTKAMEDLLLECLEEELGSVRAEQISIAEREARLKARIRSLQQQLPKLPDQTSEATKRLQDSLKEIQENQCIYLDTQCSVCHENKASKAVIPCGHLCMCDGCNQSLERLPSGMRKCPLCRGPLLSTLHIYTSK